MWIFHPLGFFSVTRSPTHPRKLQVRARVRQDLDRLRAAIAAEAKLGPTIETPVADYPYRALVDPRAFGRALAAVVADIGYGNFKSRVAEADPHRAHLYGEVWAAMSNAEARLAVARGIGARGRR